MAFTISIISYEFVLIFFAAILPKLKKNKEYYALSILLLTLFITLCYSRPFFFRDTDNYRIIYENAYWYDLQNFDFLAKEPKSYCEYGFIFAVLLFKSLGFSFRFFSAAITFFNFCCLYYFSKKTKEWLLKTYDNATCRDDVFSFLAVYLPLYGFFYNCVAIRGSLSFAFVALSTCAAYDKKYLRLIFCFIAAFSVQRLSVLALISLFLLVFWRKEIKKQTFTVIWALIGVVLIVDYWFNVLYAFGNNLQNVWNALMHTGITIGLNEVDNHALKRLLLYIAYWLNGLVYVLDFNAYKKDGVFTLIYLYTIFISLFVSGFSASYRIVDYLYIYTLPINYIALINKNRFYSSSFYIVIISALMFIVSWGLSYIQWYLYD